ncbi:MAG TPA: queuosine precursor transporter [Spirochaetia bacterium]|nr:queuosine precursor transporter [Spirochaetia bacterium]
MSTQYSFEANGTRAYILLASIFTGAIVAANLMGTKVIPFFTIAGFEFTGSVGIFLFPLTFLITDIVAEVYGPRATRTIVTGTLIVVALVLGVTALATVIPPAGRFAGQNEAYVSIFRSSLRLMVASIIAFTMSQYHDVWAFDFWKKRTKGRFLWLRNNASTMVSQLIDTVIFMLVAFWGTNERFTLAFVLGSMVPPYYAIKVLAAFLDTPFVYLGVRILRKSGVGMPPTAAAPETA